MYVDIANMLTSISVNKIAILDKMPTKLKSKTPLIFNARQPSSWFIVFVGTLFVGATIESSSAVEPINRGFIDKSNCSND